MRKNKDVNKLLERPNNYHWNILLLNIVKSIKFQILKNDLFIIIIKMILNLPWYVRFGIDFTAVCIPLYLVTSIINSN